MKGKPKGIARKSLEYRTFEDRLNAARWGEMAGYMELLKLFRKVQILQNIQQGEKRPRWTEEEVETMRLKVGADLLEKSGDKKFHARMAKIAEFVEGGSKHVDPMGLRVLSVVHDLLYRTPGFDNDGNPSTRPHISATRIIELLQEEDGDENPGSYDESSIRRILRDYQVPALWGGMKKSLPPEGRTLKKI